MDMLLLFLLLWPSVVGLTAPVASEVLCSTNACYTVHLDATAAFGAANEKCASNGGHLATVKSQEEALHLQALLLKLPNTDLPKGTLRFWIGLRLEGCFQQHKELKGYSWVTDRGGEEKEEKPFSNWKEEPIGTCVTKRCVTMIFDISSPHNFKWSDGTCRSPANGYICKFSFRGMCHQVALAGPGEVEYKMPFSATSTSLNLVPFGTMATVYCGPHRKLDEKLLICKEHTDGVFDWTSPGSFCFSPNHGCSYNNGGCEQGCSVHPGDNSVRCDCKEGYELMADRVTCAAKDHCKPNPCEQTCTNLQQDFKCSCSDGLILAENNMNCTDVDECQEAPCDQVCSNSLGSFSCSCLAGFVAVDRDCQDWDECLHDSPCTQGCINTNGSYTCFCEEGYVKGEGGSTCVDVDECQRKPCEDRCHNTPGSYECACGHGLVLAPDRISCMSKDFPIELGTIPDSRIESMNSPHAEKNRRLTQTPGLTNPGSRPDKVHQTESEEAIPAGLAPSTVVPGVVASTNGTSSGANIKDASTGEDTVLFAIVASVVVVLLLMALALGVFLCRRRAKNNKAVPESAADKYSWAESNNKAVENEYK